MLVLVIVTSISHKSLDSVGRFVIRVDFLFHFLRMPNLVIMILELRACLTWMLAWENLSFISGMETYRLKWRSTEWHLKIQQRSSIYATHSCLQKGKRVLLYGSKIRWSVMTSSNILFHTSMQYYVYNLTYF